MCTVTYLSKGENNFILTSNRDESPGRKTLPPATYVDDGIQLTYPKDKLAGGTWIGVSDLKRLVCLLNGGFEKHQRKSYYRMSRGIIVKELLKSNQPMDYIYDINLEDIEPFTIIFIDWSDSLKAFEWIWDGDKKHLQQLDESPRIWSSSPLYDKEMKLDRETWFLDWLHDNPDLSKESILKFHQNTDLGTQTTSPVMDRIFVKTVSISQLQKLDDRIDFSHQNLLDQTFDQIVI